MSSLQVFFNQPLKNRVPSYVNIQGKNATWSSLETGIVIII